MRKHFIVLTSISLISSTKESFYLLFSCLFYVGAIPLSVCFFLNWAFALYVKFYEFFMCYTLCMFPPPPVCCQFPLWDRSLLFWSHTIFFFMPVLWWDTQNSLSRPMTTIFLNFIIKNFKNCLLKSWIDLNSIFICHIKQESNFTLRQSKIYLIWIPLRGTLLSSLCILCPRQSNSSGVCESVSELLVLLYCSVGCFFMAVLFLLMSNTVWNQEYDVSSFVLISQNCFG